MASIRSERRGKSVLYVRSGTVESEKVGCLMRLSDVQAVVAEHGYAADDIEAVCDCAEDMSGLARFGRGPGMPFGSEPCVRIVRGRVFVTQWRGLDI